MFGHALTKYIIGLPLTSTTIGWPSWPRSAPVDCDQAICRCLTVFGLICVSLLLRSSARFWPIDGQRAGLALACISSLSVPCAKAAVPQTRPAAKMIAAGASILRHFGDFIWPPCVRRTGTGNSYLLQILGFSEIRSLASHALPPGRGREAAPSRADMVYKTHVGHDCVVGRYQYTRRYPPATANTVRMRLAAARDTMCGASVSTMERRVSCARPDITRL